MLYEKKILSKKTLFGYGENNSLLMSHASHYVPGVKLSTGSLGHGLPVAIGSALEPGISCSHKPGASGPY